jgi:hypothetical protein
VAASILVNGTTIASATSTTATTTLSVTFTDTGLYAAAQGSSLSGAVTFRITEAYTDDTPISTNSKTGGGITINARCSALSTTSPTTASPINLDLADPVNVIASWTRPHTAFRARLKGYVYNGATYTLIFNRYGYTTSTSMDMVAMGYDAAMVTAMASVSPRNFKLELYTQFDDGTVDYIDIGTLNASSIITNGVTHTFFTLSTVAISNFTLTNAMVTIPFTLTKYGAYSHTVRLYVGGVLIRTETGVTISGNFTIGDTERGLILSTLLPSMTGAAYASVTTEAYGTTNSTSVTATISATMTTGLSITQNPFSITSEIGTTQAIDVAGIYYYVSGNSSLLLEVKVNGVVVESTTGYPTSPTYQFANIDFNAVKTAIYDNASAHSLTGCITVTVTSYRTSPAASTNITTSAGNLTLVYRIDTLALTEPNTGSEWILDNTTGNLLSSNWSIANACFGGRLKGYVNGTLVFNLRGYTNSSATDIDAAGYHNAIAAAMSSVSPATFKLEIITQFNDGTANWLDLSYAAVEGTTQRTTSNSIIYYLYDLATISIGNITLYNTTTTIPYTLTEPKQLTYEINYYTRVSGVDTLIKTESGVTASGNFTIAFADRAAILASLLPSTTGTVVATVTTESYGTTESATATLTIDASMLGAPILVSFDSVLTMRVLDHIIETGTVIELSSTGILTIPKLIEGATDDISSLKYVTVKKLIEGEV